jgi:hypothetical protein
VNICISATWLSLFRISAISPEDIPKRRTKDDILRIELVIWKLLYFERSTRASARQIFDYLWFPRVNSLRILIIM